MTQLTSINELEELLLKNEIDFSGWGEGKNKSLENLWQELLDGDAALQMVPFQRAINFVQIIIRQNGHMLIEGEQIMANGAKRKRNRPLSEKMQPGESLEMAAVRGIQQELGVTIDEGAVQASTWDIQTVVRSSQSYPGLMTFYTVYTVEAAVPGLPTTNFKTEENSPTDPVRGHQWIWLPEEEALRLIQ